MQVGEFIASILVEIAAALALSIFGAILRTLFAWLRKLVTSPFQKKEAAILMVAENQIRELAAGRVKATQELEDAIDYLKYVLSRQFDDWRSADLRWRNQRSVTLLNGRNTVLLFVGILIFDAFGWWFGWTNTQAVVYGILGILLLGELALLARWHIQGRHLNGKFKLILKEANRALITLGPRLNINLLGPLTAIYDRTGPKDPAIIQKQLSSFGFEVKRSEIMRVTLSYQLRDKGEAERRATIGGILGAAVNNRVAFNAIPDGERKEIELMFLSNGIDNPYAEVNIVPI